VDFDLSAADVAFRDELRAWLGEHTPPDVDVAATFEDAEALREWQRTLHEGRWVGIHWPEEYGGRGASLRHRIGAHRPHRAEAQGHLDARDPDEGEGDRRPPASSDHG
jgi:alkylation response protein AidB-like acyl-CoA dehydrogenase